MTSPSLNRYKTRQALLFALLMVSIPSFAHEEAEHPPQRVPESIQHLPSAIPDRIVLTWTGDPARSQAVTWRTESSVKKSKAQIAEAEPGPQFVVKAREVAATTTFLMTDLGDCNFHTAEFAGLKPATQYLYRVGDGANWSEWLRFQTASDQPEPFSFIYFGDAQNELKAHWSRVIREAYTTAPRARFVIHAGDLVNRADSDAEWGEWFYAGGWIHAMVPSVPTPGNHEYARDEQGVSQLSRHWRPQFALPQNGPTGLEETSYFLDYQGVRIVSLNSNEDLLSQVSWLDKVLSENPCRWTVLTFHHPVFSPAVSRDNPLLRTLWKPVIDKHRVDLVLTGHDHTYARSGATTSNVPGGARVKSSQGTVYVVSVSGPKMYQVNKQDWMAKSAEGVQLYQVISIEGNALRYKAYTATGDLYDSFELHKGKDGNRLIEPAAESR